MSVHTQELVDPHSHDAPPAQPRPGPQRGPEGKRPLDLGKDLTEVSGPRLRPGSLGNNRSRRRWVLHRPQYPFPNLGCVSIMQPARHAEREVTEEDSSG
jgi:hypothetical protein